MAFGKQKILEKRQLIKKTENLKETFVEKIRLNKVYKNNKKRGNEEENL